MRGRWLIASTVLSLFACGEPAASPSVRAGAGGAWWGAGGSAGSADAGEGAGGARTTSPDAAAPDASAPDAAAPRLPHPDLGANVDGDGVAESVSLALRLTAGRADTTGWSPAP